MEIIKVEEWKQILQEISIEGPEMVTERLNQLHKPNFGESCKNRKRKGYKINPIFLKAPFV